MQQTTFWADNVERLSTMWLDGCQLGEISKALGVSRGAIAGKLSRLGLLKSEKRQAAPTTWTDERDENLKSMRADGRTMREMATELDVSRAAVSSRLGRVGLREPRRQSRASFRMPVFAPGKPYYNTQPIEAMKGLNMELLDMPERGCRYPTGENEHRHLFCGHERYGNLPYCVHHARLSYRPTARQVANLPHGKTRSEHCGSC